MENEVTGLIENDESPRDKTTEAVDVVRGSVHNIHATNVTVRQGAIQAANADRMVVRQAGMMNAKTENLEMVQGNAGLLQTRTAHLTASRSGAVLANGNVRMEQSATRLLLANGSVDIDQGGVGILVANQVKTQNSGTVFLIARNVEGNINTAFGPQESLVFGAAAGLVAGAIIMLAGLFRRRRRG